VDSHKAEQVEGRTRVQLSVSGSEELRPEISRMANEHQWVLWELHRGQASLEQLFRELTAGTGEAGEEPAPDVRAEAEQEATSSVSGEDTEVAPQGSGEDTEVAS